MNSKWHLYFSLTKSIIRILACIGILITGSIVVLVAGLLWAEILGLIEEFRD